MANFITKKFKSGFAQFVGALTGSESILIKKDGTLSPFWITITNLLAGYATDLDVTDLGTRITTKVTRQPLVSITGIPGHATAPGQQSFDPETKKIDVSSSNLMWGVKIDPSNGIIYTFNGTNFVWNSSELIEIGTGGGGEGINTIVANDLLFFDTFLNIGFYENTGYLRGTYFGRFRAPYVDQRVDTIDKIYIRSIDVSNPNATIPNFKIYGTAQTIPSAPAASEMTLILGHTSYTIKADDADSWKVTSNVDGGSIIFPNLGDITKSMTFIIPVTSYPILFNGVSIDAGNTVFAIYTLGAWTIDSTIVDIPVITNYSDISIQHKVDINVTINLGNGAYLTSNATIIAFAKNDLILLSNQTNKDEIGIYSIIWKSDVLSRLQLIVSGTSLNTVRVAGDGAYENMFDGFNPDTIAFVKLELVDISTKEDKGVAQSIVDSEASVRQEADHNLQLQIDGIDQSKWENVVNIQDNGIKYGRLYNWYAATDVRGIAPDGWHVPTREEFSTLNTFLGDNSGLKLKEVGTAHWDRDNGSLDIFGFRALPAGQYFYDYDVYQNLTAELLLITSTQYNLNNAYIRVLDDYNVNFSESDTPSPNSENKKFGLSIRLIKDNSTNEGDIVIDGDTYHSVTIGTQVWLQQNLAVKRYQNGDLIGSDFSGTEGAVTAYDNDESNIYDILQVEDTLHIQPKPKEDGIPVKIHSSVVYGLDPLIAEFTSSIEILAAELLLKINKSETLTATEIQLLISNLVDSSPASLDTLNELANALGDDPNFATTITNLIGTKVDKVTGKSLILDSEIIRLAGIFNYELSKAAIEGLLTGVITTHSHTVAKSDVGLGNVDNTSDINKAVSTAQLSKFVAQNGGIIYHTLPWINTGTVSTSGVSVTGISTVFTAAMIGAKIIVNSEERIIATYVSATNITVNSAFSQNYSSVGFGIYSKSIAIGSDGYIYMFNSVGVNASSTTPSGNTILYNRIFIGGATQAFSQTTPNIIEINSGVNGSYRDLAVRYIYQSIGTATGDAVGDIRHSNQSGTILFEKCSVANATKGSGTWVSLFSINAQGVLLPMQLPTASAPTYVKGGMYFDTTLNKMRIGGATGWETITSV